LIIGSFGLGIPTVRISVADALRVSFALIQSSPVFCKRFRWKETDGMVFRLLKFRISRREGPNEWQVFLYVTVELGLLKL